MVRYATGKKRLAEVGVWEGLTARQLRSSMASDGVYFAIDPYPVGRLGFSTQKIIAHGTISKVKRGKVVWLPVTGVEAARDERVIAAPVDFLFIDGDHSYNGLKGDWEAWRTLIAVGGFVALHDSRSTPSRAIDDAGSVQFTKEVILSDPLYTVAETVDSLTVLQRTC